MNSVFVAGSRAVSRLSTQILERLDNIMARNLTVLIGDANGADKAVQRYLAKQEYRNVIVYCMEACRNNIAGWPVREHTAKPGAKHDRFYYGIKDAAMATDATWGFMLWDGSSKGTLTNVIGLLSSDKKVLLYLSPRKQFFNLHTFANFCDALNANGVRDVPQFLSSRGIDESKTGHLSFDERLTLPGLGARELLSK
jgi:hypothetical protein